MVTTWPSCTPTSAWRGRRAGAVDHAPAPEEKVEVAHAGSIPYMASAFRAEQPGAGRGVEVAVVLAQLVDDPGVLRVAVREVGRPDEPVGAGERAEQPRGAFPGVEADPALPPEVLLGGQGHPGGGPAVALLELAEAVHPVGDPPAAALQDDHLQVRVPLEHPAVGEVGERHLLVEQQDERVVGARRHARHESPRRARHVSEPGGVQRQREPRLLERLPHWGVRLVVEGPVEVRVRAGEAADQAEVADAMGLGCRGRRVLHRERADAAQPVRCLGGPLGEPVVVDTTARHRELGILDAPELQAETRVDDGEVDALRVEDLHPLRGVEAGRVEVLVVAALPEVVERLAGVAQPDEAAVGGQLIVDEALVEARRLVPPEPDPAVLEVRGQPPGPQIRRLADMTVGVDDVLPCGVHTERIPAPDRRVNAVPIIGPQH